MKQCALYGKILYHLLNRKNVILAFLSMLFYWVDCFCFYCYASKSYFMDKPSMTNNFRPHCPETAALEAFSCILLVPLLLLYCPRQNLSQLTVHISSVASSNPISATTKP